MDEKLKKEREELTAALQSVKSGDSGAAVSVLKKEKDAEQGRREDVSINGELNIQSCENFFVRGCESVAGKLRQK